MRIEPCVLAQTRLNRGRHHSQRGSRRAPQVQLVISDHHLGLKEAIGAVFVGSAWQRCRVHTTRNLLARVPKAQQSRLAALLQPPVVDVQLADVDERDPGARADR